LRESPGTPTSPQGIGVWAAVAVILRECRGTPELLFIKRVERETDTWSGHVALPGGRRDPGDDSLLATAVRETWEEIGVDLSIIGRPLGTLSDVAPRSPVLPPIAVRPHVFVVPENCGFIVGTEVADTFWVPLEHLSDSSRRSRTNVETHGLQLEVDAILYGPHVIWGMTCRVVDDVLARIARIDRLTKI
jgi:8-oxo-dGTP pyrophosphatase MutT (NUDIX family)